MANHPSKQVKAVKRWSPNPAPAEQAQLPDYLFRELNRLSETVFNIDTMSLAETFKVPEKPRNGDIRYFGDTWPTGAGIYWYNGQSWQPLSSGAGASPLALDDLTDVDTSGKSIDDFIKWNGTSWVVTSVPPGGFSGSYNDLTNQPFIPSDVSHLSDNTNLLFSGDYNDLTNQPDILEEAPIDGQEYVRKDSGWVVNTDNQFSGDYNDLSNKPSIPSDVADLTDTTNLLDHFSGDYNDLTNQPALFSGNYNDLTNKPNIPSDLGDLTDTGGLLGDGLEEAPVDGNEYVRKDAAWVINTDATFSGDYNDLTNKPNIPADVNDLTDIDGLLDHFSGDYNDLTNTPTIPTVNDARITFIQDSVEKGSFTLNQANDQDINITDFVGIGEAPINQTQYARQNGAWAALNVEWQDVTQKPDIVEEAPIDSKKYLRENGAWVEDIDTHFSGDYNDLSNKPDIPTDVGQLTDTGNLLDHFSGDYNDLTNKPNIPIDINDLTDIDGNLFSGDYNDLTNTPTIPAAQVNSDWNATGTVAEILNKPVIPSDVGDLTDTGNLLDHFSGDYNDLTNQPTIPAAANNGTITINQGGVLKGTFTVDQATNTTVELDAGGAAASKTWIDYATGFSSVPSVIDTVDNTNWSEDGDVYEYTYSNGTLYRVIGATIDGFYNSFNALANPALTGLVAQKAITI